MGRVHLRNPIRTQKVQLCRRQLACPACGWRIMDTCASDSIDLAILYEGAAFPWKPDFVTRCQRCKNEIGIRKPHHEAGCRSISDIKMENS